MLVIVSKQVYRHRKVAQLTHETREQRRAIFILWTENDLGRRLLLPCGGGRHGEDAFSFINVKC